MADKTLICYDCNSKFIFTESEQAFYKEKGLLMLPKRCSKCRRKKRYEESKELIKFVKGIKFINRNPLDNSVLDLLKDINTNPIVSIDVNNFFYRARIITDIHETNKEKGFWGYSQKDSFIPPVANTRDMRANYRYIPYLYCSNNPYISLCEVRPRIGTILSIAKIIVKQQMKIFDFTISQEPKGVSKEKLSLCEDLSEMFSKPLSYDDDILSYIPTQYIAEYIKNLGYDGIKYNSAYSYFPNDTNSANFVIFNYSKCEAIKSNILKVNNYILNYEKVDGDDENIFK